MKERRLFEESMRQYRRLQRPITKSNKLIGHAGVQRWDSPTEEKKSQNLWREGEKKCVCACVCVCEREKERKRERKVNR
jgi:hypothetical protein